MRNPKICFIAGTLGKGGAERQLIYMLRCLKKEGHQIHVITLTKDEFYEKEIRRLNIKIHFAGVTNNRLIRLIKIISIVHKLKPDIIQSQHFYTNIYAGLSGLFCGINSLGGVRNNLTTEIKNNGILLGTLSVLLPTRLISNSIEAISNSRGFNYPMKDFFYLPNVFDFDSFKTSYALREKKLILFVGRLVYQKRAELFIEIISELLKLDSEYEGWIIGEGPDKKKLMDYAKSRGLESSNLKFLGEVENMAEFYSKATFLILTSRYEGTPNVVIEAMASGLVVLATKVGNIETLITNQETGYLFSENKLNNIYSQLHLLCLNDKLRDEITLKAKSYIKNNLSLNFLLVNLNSIFCKTNYLC